MSASSCVRSSCSRGPRAIIRARRDSFDSPSTFWVGMYAIEIR